MAAIWAFTHLSSLLPIALFVLDPMISSFWAFWHLSTHHFLTLGCNRHHTGSCNALMGFACMVSNGKLARLSCTVCLTQKAMCEGCQRLLLLLRMMHVLCRYWCFIRMKTTRFIRRSFVTPGSVGHAKLDASSCGQTHLWRHP
jgi:hypothetical protein